MTVGGVSVMGTYHEQNQDCFWSYSDEKLTVLAVSDGLGSCKLSAQGSRAFCGSVKDVLGQDKPVPSEPEVICAELHAQWLRHLDGYPISDCYATALFAVFSGGTLTMGALGDGFIAAVHGDNAVEILWDNKDEDGRFPNETDCLHEVFEPQRWRTLQIPCGDLSGLVASSDGMELYPEGRAAIAEFAKCFCGSYRAMDPDQIENDIAGWLSGWPGTDDKTVAYCLKEAGANV